MDNDHATTESLPWHELFRLDPKAHTATTTPVENAMTLCPIAIAVGCKKCPVFSVCPLKSVIGDQPKADEVKPKTTPGRKK